jgi:GalNAc-alpha-(1->4)-GalNAc-alpha-(1->3)-diNAcBac-PP-undecaprenol alpha-1,4-N-acetyl-D-galactosaminyltransferase
MRIVLVIWNIGCGGAERVLSILANDWASRNWDIHILTLESKNTPIYHKLHPSITIHPVGYDAPADAGVRRHLRIPVTIRLMSAIRDLRPDAIVSFMDSTNIKVLLSTLGTKIPVFVCEHCDPRTRPIGPLNELLRRCLYPLASSVVALSNDALSFFSPGIQARGSVIPNPVLAPPSDCVAVTRHDPKSPKRLISIGRLCPVKRFDRLIAAFGCVASLHPSWSLQIWGDGPDRKSLQKLITDLHLDAKIKLCGLTDNAYQALAAADLFALTSETEGFPMALCEAMACGLPVISMDCPSGPRQVIRSGVDGILTPNNDMKAFTSALDRLMAHQEERSLLASRAPDVIIRFSVASVMHQWDRLFSRQDLLK